MLCGGSYRIFWTVHIDHGSLYIWLVSISLGYFAESFEILCKYYFDQVYVYSLGCIEDLPQYIYVYICFETWSWVLITFLGDYSKLSFGLRF